MEINRFFSGLKTCCFNTDLVGIKRHVDELERALRVSLSRLVVSRYRLGYYHFGVGNERAGRVLYNTLDTADSALRENRGRK